MNQQNTLEFSFFEWSVPETVIKQIHNKPDVLIFNLLHGKSKMILQINRQKYNTRYEQVKGERRRAKGEGLDKQAIK
jgi:hypothetical protein